MLTQVQKSFYQESGYIKVDQAVTPDQLAELKRFTYDLIDRSRDVTESSAVYELENGPLQVVSGTHKTGILSHHLNGVSC